MVSDIFTIENSTDKISVQLQVDQGTLNGGIGGNIGSQDYSEIYLIKLS